jgi:CheY-like chemotaxis protein
VAEQVQTGLHFADYYLPTAIFANLRLPGADGWTMIRRLKANPETRHTPVFTVSPEEDHLPASVHGAAGHVVEPITASGLDIAFHQMERLRSIKDRTVLALAPDQERLARIVEAVGGGPIEIISAATATEAKAALDSHAVHAVVVHAAMGEIDQRRFIHAMQHPSLPVILFSDRVLNAFPHDGIRQYADRANISVVDTPDQLLLSLILCLHLMPEALNDDHRDRLRAMDARQSMMKDRKVLLVDDDMRTVFAVTNVLEDQGAEVLTGKTGKESLDKLDAFPDIDLILMDVMIAEVDGYRAIREIRNQDRYRTLPIIALTAKAMKGDRSKCISAGADDYLAKPVNLDKLKSMLKIWLDPQLAAPRTIGR